MAIKLRTLIKDPKARRRLTRRSKATDLKCCVCQKPFTEWQERAEGTIQITVGLVCSGCYYKALGEAVEKSPIPSPRVRRG
jgi:hypothetical protein